MKINQINLQTAIQQVTAEKVMFSDEKDGSAWLRAIEKAEKNLRENHTIYFVDGTLRFKSLDSKLTRIVTASGCVASFCDCQDKISYHKALHAILTNYTALESQPLAEGAKSVYAVGGLETHYVVENGRQAKTLERIKTKTLTMITWSREKTHKATPPPVVAEILQFKSKPETESAKPSASLAA